MPANRIRSIAICVFEHHGRYLLIEGYDFAKQSYYYRPMGGGIEFTETGKAAVIREIREEIGADIQNVQQCCIFENIFTLNGAPGHEVVFVYSADFADQSYYRQEVIMGSEDDGSTFKMVWRGQNDFDEQHRLVPEKLAGILKASSPH
ncbi:MAG: NUDIX domain-containing protein [Chitinivibrionales bacterium]|nr:NUDIX domain-containing protein [Chitinivibrionales bacterium]